MWVFFISSLRAILSLLVRLSCLFCWYLSTFHVSDMINVLLSDNLSGFGLAVYLFWKGYFGFFFFGYFGMWFVFDSSIVIILCMNFLYGGLELLVFWVWV